MKVGVITRHAITNYGSLLQTMATQQVLTDMGHDCEIIDYIRNDETYSEHEKTLLRQKASWNNNPLKKCLYLALRQPESKAAGKRFEKARKKLLCLSKRYSTLDELNEVSEADVYITGSDQVWGPVANGTYDSAYCLSFVPDDKKKIAYAASFGRVEFSDEFSDHYKKWLSRYSHIAVREESAVKLLEDLGIESSTVLDPTLLLDKEYWKKYFAPIKHKQYVLVYQLHNDKKLGRYAEAVAKKMGLPLIRVSVSFHQISREGKFVWCPEVEQFLSYINDAECVITDSFHATAFSINLNTPFVSVLPNNKTGTRNMSILQLTGLTDRVLKDENDTSLALKEIDFAPVNEILKKKREDSLATLKRMLEE